MADGESHVVSGQGSEVLFTYETMLNSSTLKTFFKKSGLWPKNVMKLIVLYVTQLKVPVLVLNNSLSSMRN